MKSSREQAGWYFYDFANSAFSSTVVTPFLGPYLLGLALAASDGRGFVHPLGLNISARAWWSYVLAASVALQVVFLPLIGALADYSRRKKLLLALLAYGGALPTIALFWVRGEAYLAGGLLFLWANLCFGASVVVYNSYLPQIARPQERDAVSSKGWGLGYLGGGTLLALNVLLVFKADALGLRGEEAVRISLASAGVWWALFTLIPLAALKTREPALAMPPGENYLTQPVRQLARTVRELRRQPQALRFLLAYLLYNDAIQAVIGLASQFGTDELKMSMASLATMTLMVQFVAVLGALGFNRIAARTGAKRAIMFSLAVWSAVIVAIFAWVRTGTQFFALAAVVALVLGGSQALSRSLFSQMIPKGKEAEYFGIYEISDKGTSWLCPLLFGLALQFTGSYRAAVLSLLISFLAGMAVLARVRPGTAR
ncbi:MAG: MFS transporter [Bryobacteraceae bacterium]